MPIEELLKLYGGAFEDDDGAESPNITSDVDHRPHDEGQCDGGFLHESKANHGINGR